MIKVKGRIMTFTGKDLQILREHAAKLGLSEQDTLTGSLWEMIMQKARDGVFLKSKKRG